MTEEELLVIGRTRFPEMAKQELEAATRLREIIYSGDPARVSEGAQALADWWDARCAMIVYADIPDFPSAQARQS